MAAQMFDPRSLLSDSGDLRTSGKQDIAYGVYIYHIKAPGVGEHVGKFAVVK